MAHAPKVLVYEKFRTGDRFAGELRALGIEAHLPFGPQSRLLRQTPISAERIIELASGFPAVIGASAVRWTREVLTALPDLRFISKLGIGYEVIDLQAATELGVAVSNTPSIVEIDCVAEHTIALMLAAAKRLYFYDARRMRSGGWLDSAVESASVRGRTVGLVGFGRIGRAVARRLRLWGAEILAHDLADVPAEEGVRLVGLDELLARSDYVSLHLSTGSGSGVLLDRERLRLLKPGAVVVNTARGSLIDTVALAEGLTSGAIGAAALDVFSPEPPFPDDPLLALPNLLLTPHSAVNVPEAEVDMERMAARNLAQMFAGQAPAALVNNVTFPVMGEAS
jgi:D-3-phosphoglycerate dehydrogenase